LGKYHPASAHSNAESEPYTDIFAIGIGITGICVSNRESDRHRLGNCSDHADRFTHRSANSMIGIKERRSLVRRLFC
jgi:hypothetical protein